MKQYIIYIGLCWMICCLPNYGCREASGNVSSKYNYLKPVYDKIELRPQSDTLNFQLEDSNYNNIGSFNYFNQNGKELISFYDKNSKSLLIYDFNSRNQILRIPFKKWFVGERFKKVYTYVVNFDSIFVITDKRLFMVDSSSRIKKGIELFNDPKQKALCDNETPAVLQGNMLYMGVEPALNETSLKEHQQWKVVCGFNLINDEKELLYELPLIYKKDLYGYPFMNYCYCINDRGNFVFSFPADTSIYETNFKDIHNAYFGKSFLQTETIAPLTKKQLENGDSYKEYNLRESYGSIYYDPYNKRYIRLAKQKINESDFMAKNRIRGRTLIIFDEQFKIIGESPLADKYEPKSIFFTPNGMYARFHYSDEQAIHLVRLNYSDKIAK